MGKSLLLAFSLFFLVSCATVVKPTFVKTDLPELQVYEVNSSIDLTGKVIGEYMCLPKPQFNQLTTNYTDLQEALDKHNKQVNLYLNRKD